MFQYIECMVCGTRSDGPFPDAEAVGKMAEPFCECGP